MSTAEAISRIADELKKRNDAALIEELTHMLGISEPETDDFTPEYKAWINERADKAEQDIKAGRFSTLEEVRARLDARFKA